MIHKHVNKTCPALLGDTAQNTFAKIMQELTAFAGPHQCQKAKGVRTRVPLISLLRVFLDRRAFQTEGANLLNDNAAHSPKRM